MCLKENQGLMNNTKWNEIRLAMYNYPLPIQWRTKDIKNSYICDWDSEWYYHFSIDNYKTIEWLEIKTENEEIKKDIIDLLKKIHVPGEILSNSVKIYGYKKNNSINYI
ncbi:hypothetical protein SZ39_2005 [Bacillus mycoides]|uniref:DUF6678 family protein n=1 Tax=Bacillus mycoides TaxID=1405 RepID=UPI0005C8D09C|nr:DUF6678 family protein [Bacillus mycoides]KIV73480.1 hypothetical protein SZ39_2005 [Bacillus mycoides]